MKIKGAVATGHPQTTAVAESVLCAGGNAFDAALAGYFMACVVEPVLASLGGGGFLLAKKADEKPIAMDFFVQTPQQKKPTAELDCEDVMVDFGSATQKFHMGHGTVAVPGCIKGAFEIHRQFCRMPMAELAAPAIAAIKQGVEINREQAHILTLVEPIYTRRKSAQALFADKQGHVLQRGQIYQNQALADVLEVLALEGEQLFYQGEIAAKIQAQVFESGGSIGRDDLSAYQLEYRQPLALALKNHQVYLNPPPSAGGLLIQFAGDLLLAELESAVAASSNESYLLSLADAIELTQQARIQAIAESDVRQLQQEKLFDPVKLLHYRQLIANRQKANRGTTHLSVLDSQGNMAALTISNGEGCGEILAGTGIMLNNMLGEDDLNPMGFNQWTRDRRLSSMMCPAIALGANRQLALGSGGSNRIRTAVLQVLLNNLLLEQDLSDAVRAPRLHFDDRLYLEAEGMPADQLAKLKQKFPDLNIFPKIDFYFGGVNAVSVSAQGAQAAADPRRGGSAVVV